MNRGKLCHTAWIIVIAIGFVYSAGAHAQDRGDLDRGDPDPEASGGGEALCENIFLLSRLRYVHNDFGANRKGLHNSLPHRGTYLQSKGYGPSARWGLRYRGRKLWRL
jgi:hypothetical protein